MSAVVAEAALGAVHVVGVDGKCGGRSAIWSDGRKHAVLTQSSV